VIQTDWHKLTKDVQSAAIEWHVRLSAAEASDAEHDAFAAWILADIQNAAAYAHVEMMDARIDHARLANASGLDHLLVESTQKAEPALANDNLFSWRKAMAASIAGLLILSVAVFGYRLTTPATEQIAMSAPIDQFRTARLSDGSTITLAPGATFKAEFGKHGRDLSTLSGVAYFDVAPDPKRPFTIALQNHIITVVGTEFEVAAFDNHQSVAVAEGVVAVRNASAAPQDAMHLTIGDQMSMTNESPDDIVTRVAPAEIGVWRDGFLEFNNANAVTIIDKLNRFYGRPIYSIDTDNPPLVEFSGVLTLADPKGTAQRLSELTTVRATLTEGGYLLSAE
jgi:transmembrane sensor